MKTRHLLIVIPAVIVLAYAARTTDATGPAPNPAIVRDLEEIVQLRERIAAHHELLLTAGRAADDGRADIALAEARIDLARERDQKKDVLTELQHIVSLHEARLARVKARSTDLTEGSVIDEIRADMLQARIRLARTRARSAE